MSQDRRQDLRQKEMQKQAIYSKISDRRKKYIQKIGYENWDPFAEPKDPIDIRKDKTKRTAKMLVTEFLQRTSHASYSNAYGRGVLEMALGIINNDDRYIAMYEFALWHHALLETERDDGE
jgi:hypothetical protein